MAERFKPAPPLEDLRSGSEAALRSFNDFIEQRRSGLVNLATRNLQGSHAKQGAEDVVQDALLGVWNNIPRMKDDNLEGYVAKAVFRRALSHGKRTTREKQRSLLQEPEALPIPKDSSKDTSDQIAQKDSYSQLVSSLKEKLPENFLQPLLLHAEGYEYVEIAEKLNIPLGTVQSRIYRGKRKANQVLRETGEDQGYAKREDDRTRGEQ